METVGIILLVACILTGLVLIPLGLPGLWVMVAGVLAFGWLSDFRTVGVWTIVLVVGLAFVGEVLEAWIGFRFARAYGGSRSAGWGALIGGVVGAIVGVPIPIIGSVIGAFAGSFLGAALFEYAREQRAEVAARAGWGAVLGRAAAAAAKMALGVVIGVVGMFAVWG